MTNEKKKSAWVIIFSSIVLAVLVLGILTFAFLRWIAPIYSIGSAEIYKFCMLLLPFLTGILLIVLGLYIKSEKQRKFDEALRERNKEKLARKPAAEEEKVQPEQPVPEQPSALAAQLVQEAEILQAPTPSFAEKEKEEAEEEEEPKVSEDISDIIEALNKEEKAEAEEPYVSILDDTDPIIRAIDAVVLQPEDYFEDSPVVEAVDRTDWRACVTDELESAHRIGYIVIIVKIPDSDPEKVHLAFGETADIFFPFEGSNVLVIAPFINTEEAKEILNKNGFERYRIIEAKGKEFDSASIIKELEKPEPIFNPSKEG